MKLDRLIVTLSADQLRDQVRVTRGELEGAFLIALALHFDGCDIELRYDTKTPAHLCELFVQGVRSADEVRRTFAPQVWSVYHRVIRENAWERPTTPHSVN